METRPVHFAFASQKGGVGKIHLYDSDGLVTALRARLSRGRDRLRDYPQYSVLRQRQRDTASAEASALVRQRLEAQFGRLDRQPYPVLQARPQTALRNGTVCCPGQEAVRRYSFDLPGTMARKRVLFRRWLPRLWSCRLLRTAWCWRAP